MLDKHKLDRPYKISRTEARNWYNGAQSIPQGVRDGADNSVVERMQDSALKIMWFRRFIQIRKRMFSMGL